MITSSCMDQMPKFQLCSAKAFILAIGIHAIYVMAYFYFNKENTVLIQEPELAVMMSLSENVQALSDEKQIVGVDQQLAVASQKKVEQDVAEKQPDLIVNENADILIEKPKKRVNREEMAKVTPVISPVKPSPIISENVSSQSAPSSSRSVAKQQSNDVSANYDSDSESSESALALWQAKTKGHLNRYKAYPEEAKSKGRTGVSKVRFIVDEQGYVISSELILSSGVRSLDREAQRVLKRAEPLPIPPIELLSQGKIMVEMPIEFSTLTF
ncbi:TonB family protein [Proteus vulgaris]|uniref:energy transducer TonB family protein n=1 Tax=Proteus TaxID=583 RepID=UPI00200B4606|nr:MULTISPECIES: TonB family protein [Proteus]MCK9781573.1 TonB family protein [Proteus columbae]MCT6518243.1 TonB family protein [Proteus vulgaris]